MLWTLIRILIMHLLILVQQAQPKSHLTQDSPVTQNTNTEVRQRSYVRRVPQWRKNKKSLRPNGKQPPRVWPNDGFWVTDFYDVHNNMGTGTLTWKAVA